MANDLKSEHLIPINHIAVILCLLPSTGDRRVRDLRDFPRPFRLSSGCIRWNVADIATRMSELVA